MLDLINNIEEYQKKHNHNHDLCLSQEMKL